jgi:glycosyltransferase involved in cell wall biosynthesis
MAKITVLTLAYNAEKTLSRAVDSILAQSFRDFEYVLIDHGSTDGTRSIVQKYEKRDSRVCGVYLNENGLINGDFNYTAKLIVDQMKISTAQWCVLLDSDDKYERNALKNMLKFAEENACDIVVCGSKFVDEQTGELRGQRMMQSDICLRNEIDFNDRFPIYHQFMRAYWAKLISLDIFRKPEFTVEQKNIICDTGIMLAAFEESRVIGFLSEPLHTWYMSSTSTSATLLTHSRVEFNTYCYTRAIDLLNSKCGFIAPRNREFMLCVLMNELKDSFGVLLGADMPQSEKLGLMYAMFINDNAKQLAAYERFGALFNAQQQWTELRRQFFSSATEWLLSREEVPENEVEGYCELGTFVSAAAEHSGAWVVFKKLYVQFLIDQGRSGEATIKLNEFAELLPGDEEVLAMRERIDVEDRSSNSNSPLASNGEPYGSTCASTPIDISANAKRSISANIVILGVNQWSVKLKQIIDTEVTGSSGDKEFGLLYFCDENEKNIGKSLESVEIISLNRLKQLYRSGNIDKMIVAYSGFSYPYNKIYELLNNIGITDKVYIVPLDWYSAQSCGLADALVEADMTRGVVDFIEIDICPHCNFACKGCGACAPLMNESYMSIDEFEETLQLLKTKFWHISRFRISGGETLLHPECAEFVRLARRYYPATEMAVQSNGLLIYTQPKKLEALFEAMRECNCRMYISAYKPTVSKQQFIFETLQKYSIEFFWAGPANGASIDEFFCKKIQRPQSDMQTEYELCGASGVCHLIRDGFLYPCGNVTNGFMRIEEAFGIKFEGFDESLEQMRINIRDTNLNGYEITQRLNKATPACRYCSAKRQINYAWEQVPRKQAKLKDYVIDA